MTIIKHEINDKNLATVEFSFDAAAVEAEKAKAFKKNAPKFNVPGFRKGKAPRSIIEKMYGTGVFLEDAINALINENYEEIIKAAEKDVVSRPDFDVVSFEGDLVMKAEMYVKPDVKIAKYKSIKLNVVKPPVTDAEIDNEIDMVRKRQAREIEVTDRPTQEGDTVVLDYEGSVDGVPFDGGKANGHHLKLGSGSFIPGFEDQLIGKNAGEDVEVNVTFPEEYHAKELAGKAAVFKCKINKVTYEELPALDDDFAVEVSEFNTFAEYKADMTAKIQKRHDDQADAEVTEKIDAKLAELLDADIPACMIDNEVEGMVRDAESRISMNGIDFKTYLNYFGMTLDQYKENARPTAETRVKSRLALEKIAEQEKLEVSEEDIEKEYADIAAQYNVELDYAKANLPVEEVRETLVIRAATAFVKGKTKVTYLDKEPEEKPAEKAEEKAED